MMMMRIKLNIRSQSNSHHHQMIGCICYFGWFDIWYFHYKIMIKFTWSPDGQNGWPTGRHLWLLWRISPWKWSHHQMYTIDSHNTIKSLNDDGHHHQRPYLIFITSTTSSAGVKIFRLVTLSTPGRAPPLEPRATFELRAKFVPSTPNTLNNRRQRCPSKG